MSYPKPIERCRRLFFQTHRMKLLHRILFSRRCWLTVFGSGLIWAAIAVSHPVRAQILELETDQVLEDNSQLPWVLEADEVTYDQRLDQYVARGSVQIARADKRLKADLIQYEHRTQRAIAQGNVELTVGTDILSGTYMQINLASQMGYIENAYLYLQENNFHITADKIEKTAENTYRIDAATLTTCDGSKPSWKISARDVRIKADGAGTAKHAVLRARNLPVLYTPFFYYPARSDRQSGFLMPELGESQRKGYEYNQPFFWAISESADATFYGHYMSKRGIKPGAEFRYILNERAKGTLMLDGIHDKKIDDGGNSSSLYGYKDLGEQVLRTEDNRYWFRMSHHQTVPWGFFAKFDLDVASDQDYLREFQIGFMGYEDTNAYFLKAFQRQLDDYNDPIRVNRLNLNRIWPKFSLNFEPRWNDDTRRDINTRETLQRLPFLGLDGAKQKILASPFYFDLTSQYNYFWRDTGTRGQRLDVQPRIYFPFRIKRYLTVEPSAGYRQTLYRLDKNNFEGPDDPDQWSHRELFDTRLELFSEIEKVFDSDSQLFERIKHRIRPQLTHEFRPDSRQGNLPLFDAIDRIDETNRITYALTNTLTSKSKKIKTQKLRPNLRGRRDDLQETTADYQYNDFLRLKFAHSYDFERSNRPFSPITAELDVLPQKFVSINADAQYSVYDNKFLSHNIQGSLWDNRGDELYVNYSYEKATKETNVNADIQSINGDLKVQLTDKFSVNGGYVYNFVTDQRIKTSGGFTYSTQCWAFKFDYTKEPNDWKVGFYIELLGLGGFRY